MDATKNRGAPILRGALVIAGMTICLALAGALAWLYWALVFEMMKAMTEAMRDARGA